MCWPWSKPKIDVGLVAMEARLDVAERLVISLIKRNWSLDDQVQSLKTELLSWKKRELIKSPSALEASASRPGPTPVATASTSAGPNET